MHINDRASQRSWPISRQLAIANGAALVALFLYFFFYPKIRKNLGQFGAANFRDSKYLSNTLILFVSVAVWQFRKSDRPQAWLLTKGATAWWTRVYVRADDSTSDECSLGNLQGLQYVDQLEVVL